MKRLLALLVAASIGLLATPANADVVTRTVRERNVTETLTNEPDPCFGTISGEITYNGVFHVTRFTSGPNEGTRHFTFTQTGRFTITPDGSDVTYRGHFTIWGGFNLSRQNRSSTFTFTVVGRASDGSRVREHVVEHFNKRKGGIRHHFSFETVRCPAA
jgi:hypothetical protein